ncbi:MAG: hypothetical protein E7013_01465 [Alphaproteobacteria bacterium]|nr:hypothetical protein [Alphaproteobacteria bacterium]
MRYLVETEEKQKKIYLWEDDVSHTMYVNAHQIDFEKVSSVGYVYFNPDDKKWILAGAISWTGEGNVPSDKRRVLAYIKQHCQHDVELVARLSEQWKKTQQQNEIITKKNPVLAFLVKKVLERE